jgi:hypothetical protein
VRPRRTKQCTLIVPFRVDEVVDGQRFHGDGAEEIGPDHPDFERWSGIIERYEALAAEPGDDDGRTDD